MNGSGNTVLAALVLVCVVGVVVCDVAYCQDNGTIDNETMTEGQLFVAAAEGLSYAGLGFLGIWAFISGIIMGGKTL